jgi:hypothetical protein
MAKRFKVGDHVTWSSEAGQVSGRIVKVHTKDAPFKGYVRHASKDEPQYEIKSDKTDHVAVHKGSAFPADLAPRHARRPSLPVWRVPGILVLGVEQPQHRRPFQHAVGAAGAGLIEMGGMRQHVLARHGELGARRHGVDLRAA